MQNEERIVPVVPDDNSMGRKLFSFVIATIIVGIGMYAWQFRNAIDVDNMVRAAHMMHQPQVASVPRN